MLDTKNEIKIEKNFFAEKTLIVSKSGYGKSYTARVIIEEGRALGVSFIIIDPQDAYLNLPDFDYILAERVINAQKLGILLSQSNRNVVIRTKHLTIEQQNLFLSVLIGSFRQHIRKGIQTIIIDEAHKFVPEQEKTEAKDVIRGMFQENRSDGLGIIAVTQRIARVDKTIVSQADNLAIGRLTSHVDCETIKNYLDNVEDISQIKKLDRGTFYLSGLGLDTPQITKIRHSKTEHSGNTPENLIKENRVLYNKYIPKYVKYKNGEDMKMDSVSTKNELVSEVVPSMQGIKDLALIGVEMGAGLALSGVVSSYLSSQFVSPVPYVSTRTLASAGTTLVLYVGYRKLPAKVKPVLLYACAGSMAHTLGSLAYDVMYAMGVNMPAIGNFLLSTATGVSPVAVEQEASETGTGIEAIDTNTAFA